MKRSLFACLLLAGILFSHSLRAATFDVSTATEFQEALDAADITGEENTINLAPGTYSSSSVFSYNTLNIFPLNIVGHLTNGEPDVIIKTTGQDGLDITTGATISVSNIAFGDDVSGNVTGLKINDTSSEVSYVISIDHCVFKNNSMSGLSVTNSNASGSLTVSNSSFSHNENGSEGGSGAGIYVMSNQTFPVTIKGNTFDQNQASADGGAVWVKTQGSNSPIIIGGSGEGEANIFTTNSAGGNGGALFADTDDTGDTISITYNTFGGSDSLDGNSAMIGGAAYIYASYGLTFENNLVQNNTSSDNNGGVIVEIDGDSDNTSSNNISNNTISNNSSTGGQVGGMAVKLNCDCALTFNANLISGNTALEEDVDAGGLLIDYQSGSPLPLTMTNNVIVDNQANGSGGGLIIYDNLSVNIYITNNTFANNSAENGNGGGIYLSIPPSSTSSYDFYNNIFWGNSAGFGPDTFINSGNYLYPGLFVKNNDVDTEGFCLYILGVTPCNSGTDFSNVTDNGGHPANNISADPLFVQVGSGANYYLLQTTSPALGVGDGSILVPGLPSTDFYDQPLLSPPTLGALQNPGLAAVSVDPSSKDYGHVDVGSSSSQLFTITNSGSDTLVTSSLVLSDTTNFTLITEPSGTNPPSPCGSLSNPSDVFLCDVGAQASNACGDTPTLYPGNSCVIEIVFNPTVAQNISANLLITSNASASPTSVALSGSAASGCAPVLALTITSPGDVEVGDNTTFGITMSNSASCDSENTNLALTFSDNMEFQSGSGVDQSIAKKVMNAIRMNSSSITCTGSGTSATCNVGTLAAGSSLNLNITAKAIGEGALSLTANLTNQAGTATASGIATATAISSSINGGGCSLNATQTNPANIFWIYSLLLILPLIRGRKSFRN